MTKQFTLLLLLFIGAKMVAQPTGIASSGMTHCDTKVASFMTTYGIPGATFCMARNGKLVYMRAFGKSDVAGTVTTQPYNLFRIASLSKQITAIAIMKMVDNGQLTLSSKVFGPGSILQNHPVFSTTTITDTRIYDITVQQLLEHTAGWNRDINCFPTPTAPYPWFYGGCDPIAVPMHIAQQTGTTNPVSKDAMIKYLLQKGLNFTPGTAYNYSNIGYLVLGRVIEQIGGLPYETWVQNNIFTPLGICDMHLAKNLKADKREREGEYVGNGYTTLSLYNTGQTVPWEYGGFSVEAMDAHGGWVATASDLVRLLVAIDGFNTKPDILSAASINTMVAPSTANANYAKGWQVNASGNWWHTGALDGTASIQARTSGGYTWAVILNKRNVTNTSNFWSALDNLPWSCMSGTTTWPTWDLMDAPVTNSSNISFTNVAANSLTVNWTNGDGDRRVLVARKKMPVDGFPADGADYTANPAFGTGINLGNNSFVVYDGTGSSATITNLQADSTYYFRLFDYKKNTNTGNNSIYLRCNSTEASKTMSVPLPVTFDYFNAKLINRQLVSLQWQTRTEINSSYFEVEKSTDGTAFKSIGKVTATGNTVTPATYNFSDTKPVEGTNYYRLKQVDKDGKAATTSIKSIRMSKQGFSVYPTLASQLVTVQADTEIGNTNNIISVVDFTGKVWMQQRSTGQFTKLNISQLAVGTYIVKVTTANEVYSTKVTKL